MAMSYTTALMEPSVDVDKLSYEIFTILESEFLFGGCSGSTTPSSNPLPSNPGKVRVLSIDAGAGLLPALALSRLESHLRRLSGDPSARLADFFDLAAGSGAGGVLAAMLFTRGPDGRPLFSADDALRTLSLHRRRILAKPKKGILAGIFRRSASGIFSRLFGGATLKDTLKPVLVPCYDAATGAPFVFSRADAVEAEEYDFTVAEVCAATCGGGAVEVRSVDGRTRVVAVGGGAAAMVNPAAAAITHVLNNKWEFPIADGLEDLLVVSFGGGEGRRGEAVLPSSAELVRIAGEGTADMVDQTVAMAFGHNRTTNYVRIQANGLGSLSVPVGTKDAATAAAAAAAALSERNVESVLFQGRKISEKTNSEKLEWFADELIKEQERRVRSPVPTVVIKPGVSPPRTSCATTATTSTRTSTTTASSSSLSSSSMH